MEPLVCQPEAHHYVPKFYLKGFSDTNGQLWAFEQRKPPRASSPKEEAQRPDYYAFGKGAERTSKVEDALGRMESMVAPIFRKIGNPQFQLTERQRIELFTFVAMMFVRVPAWREYLDHLFGEVIKRWSQRQARDSARFHADVKRMEERTGAKVGDAEKLRDFILRGDYKITQGSDAYNMRFMFESCLNISEILSREFGYKILYAPPGQYYITSDNPVVTIGPDPDGTASIGTGFGWANTEVVMPLNKRACLILSRQFESEKAEASNRRLATVNNLMMAVAQRFVYAPVGHKRLARLFDERGCRVKYGENAFMSSPPSKSKLDKLHNPKAKRR